jgi:flagellar protein FliL
MSVAAAKTTKGKRGKVLLLAGVVIILISAGCALWFSGALQRLVHHDKSTAQPEVAVPVLVDVPDIVTNLDAGPHRTSFVKLKAKLELRRPGDQASLYAHMPEIVDTFQTYLRSARPDDLRGAEGTYELRESLLNRVIAIVAPVEVTDVLFAEVLVQ